MKKITKKWLEYAKADLEGLKFYGIQQKAIIHIFWQFFIAIRLLKKF